MTGESASKIQTKFLCLYYKGWQTNISPVSAKLCVLLNKTTAQKKRGPERGPEGGPEGMGGSTFCLYPRSNSFPGSFPSLADMQVSE